MNKKLCIWSWKSDRDNVSIITKAERAIISVQMACSRAL